MIRVMAISGVPYEIHAMKDWLGFSSTSIEIRCVARKITPMFGTGDSLSVKEGIQFKISTRT